MRLFGWVGRRLSTSLMYAQGSCPFMRAVWGIVAPAGGLAIASFAIVCIIFIVHTMPKQWV